MELKGTSHKMRFTLPPIRSDISEELRLSCSFLWLVDFSRFSCLNLSQPFDSQGWLTRKFSLQHQLFCKNIARKGKLTCQRVFSQVGRNSGWKFNFRVCVLLTEKRRNKFANFNRNSFLYNVTLTFNELLAVNCSKDRQKICMIAWWEV